MKGNSMDLVRASQTPFARGLRRDLDLTDPHTSYAVRSGRGAEYFMPALSRFEAWYWPAWRAAGITTLLLFIAAAAIVLVAFHAPN